MTGKLGRKHKMANSRGKTTEKYREGKARVRVEYLQIWPGIPEKMMGGIIDGGGSLILRSTFSAHKWPLF